MAYPRAAVKQLKGALEVAWNTENAAGITNYIAAYNLNFPGKTREGMHTPSPIQGLARNKLVWGRTGPVDFSFEHHAAGIGSGTMHTTGFITGLALGAQYDADNWHASKTTTHTDQGGSSKVYIICQAGGWADADDIGALCIVQDDNDTYHMRQIVAFESEYDEEDTYDRITFHPELPENVKDDSTVYACRTYYATGDISGLSGQFSLHGEDDESFVLYLGCGISAKVQVNPAQENPHITYIISGKCAQTAWDTGSALVYDSDDNKAPINAVGSNVECIMGGYTDGDRDDDWTEQDFGDFVFDTAYNIQAIPNGTETNGIGAWKNDLSGEFMQGSILVDWAKSAHTYAVLDTDYYLLLSAGSSATTGIWGIYLPRINFGLPAEEEVNGILMHRKPFFARELEDTKGSTSMGAANVLVGIFG